MTLARWLIAGTCLLLFWLFAATVWAPAIERSLTKAAQPLLSGIATGYEPLRVGFKGQHATLSGRVRHAADREAAAAIIKDQVRATTGFGLGLGRSLNPVAGITNDIEVAPYPPGWLLLAAQGSYATLIGSAGTEFEARDAAALLRERWASAGGTLETNVTADSSRFDEAPAAEATFSSAPAPLSAEKPKPRLWAAKLGAHWEALDAGAGDAELRSRLTAMGATDLDWQERIVPMLTNLRQQMQRLKAQEDYLAAQAKLPPPHVFLAARDRRLLIVGEMANLGLKRSLLNEIIKTFPNWKIIDEVRVNPQCRAVADFGPITSALLPPERRAEADKSLVLGLSAHGWQPLDWQVAVDSRPWLSALPKDLPPELLARDSQMAMEWLQGDSRGIPALPPRAQPSFLTLTLLPDRVILAGQLAEEALRSQLAEAARQSYGSRATVTTEDLLARGTCEPSADVQQTVRSLPALPAPGEAPVIAFALPGHVWRAAPATPEMLNPGGLRKAGLLPKDFPDPMAEDTFAEAFDHVRAAWQKQKTTADSAP